MADGYAIVYLITVLTIILIHVETIVFAFYYHKKAKESNKKFPGAVILLIASVLVGGLYIIFIFILNYKECNGIDDKKTQECYSKKQVYMPTLLTQVFIYFPHWIFCYSYVKTALYLPFIEATSRDLI